MSQFSQRITGSGDDGGGSSYPSNRFGGRGEQSSPQGEINATAYIDDLQLKANSNVANSRRTVFSTPNNKNTLSITTGDDCFQFKDTRLNDDAARKFYVASALNGLGVEAFEAFPNDVEMQVECIKNMIKPVGRSTTVKEFTGFQDQQGFSLQTDGVKSGMASDNFLPGQLTELVVPNPIQIYKGNYVRKPGDEPDAIKLERRPYNPSRLGVIMLTHLTNQLKDTKKYVNGMNKDYRSTSKWLNAGQSFFDFITFSAIMAYLLFRKMRPVMEKKYPSGYPAATDPANTAEEETIKLLRAFKLIQNSTDPSKRFTSEQYEFFSKFRREFLSTVITDGTSKNHLFGFQNGDNKGITKQGKLDDSVEGEIISLQLNCFRRAISGFSDAYRSHMEFIDGMCVKGATKGSLFPRI